MEFKDVVKASAVCQQWYQLTTPKTHHSLKLLRYRYVQNGYHLGEQNIKKLRNMEVMSCIEDNTKYSELVKHLKLTITIDVSTSKHLFSTFCNLSHLEFSNLPMSQDLILTCLRPLQNLISLSFDKVRVTELIRKKFEFDIVKLPTQLKILMLINRRYRWLPSLFKESMMTHTNLEEFVFDNIRETDLLSPFVTSYPTLKRLTLKQGYGVELKDKAQEIIQSNPQLTELSYSSAALDVDIISLIDSNLTKLHTLNLQGSKYSQPDRVAHVQFTKRENLSSFTVISNQLSTESYIGALNQMSNLRQLEIGVGEQYKRITAIIRHKYSKLEHLTFSKPLFDWGDNDRMFEKQFIKDEINDTTYTCSERLRRLNFINLEILALEPSALVCFPNLEAVQFNYRVRMTTKPEVRDTLRCHLKRFSGWRFEFKVTYTTVEGFLYRKKPTKPNKLLVQPCVYR